MHQHRVLAISSQCPRQFLNPSLDAAASERAQRCCALVGQTGWHLHRQNNMNSDSPQQDQQTRLGGKSGSPSAPISLQRQQQVQGGVVHWLDEPDVNHHRAHTHICMSAYDSLVVKASTHVCRSAHLGASWTTGTPCSSHTLRASKGNGDWTSNQHCRSARRDRED